MTQEHRSTMRALSIFELLAFGDNSEGYTLTEIATNYVHPKAVFPRLYIRLQQIVI